MENEYLDKVLSEHGHHVFSKWNAPKNAVYIGRGSIFGNPFPMQNKSEQERERVCVEYRKYLAKRIDNDPEFRSAVKELKGKNVACFCSNGKTSRQDGARWCHGHILLACADYLNQP